jgi:rRNA-processing protein FCF1
MQLRTGIDAHSAIASIGSLRSQLEGYYGRGLAGGRDWAERERRDYISWAERVERMFTEVFEDLGPQLRVQTGRYWHIIRDDADWLTTNGILRLEQEHQLKSFERAIKTLEGWDAWAAPAGGILMPDTNALFHYQRFNQIDWPTLFKLSHVRLVVAHVILDELDDLKYRDPRRSKRATAVLKTFDQFIDSATTPGTVKLRDRVTLEILPDERDHDRLTNNDAEFLSRANLLSQLAGRRVNVVTADRGMRVRAATWGLPVLQLPEEYRVPIDPTTGTAATTDVKSDG